VKWTLARVAILLISISTIAFRASAEKPVQLLVEDADLNVKNMDASLLLREVLRQGVLIAARDELNLPTRDAAMREPIDPADKTLTPHFSAPKGKPVSFSLTIAGQDKPLFETTFDVPNPGHHTHRNVLPLAEKMAMLSQKELVSALQQAGFTKAEVRAGAATTQPDAKSEERLGSFEIISQLEVVRRAHAQLAFEPDSAAAMQLLVRAYANLGQITEYFWNAAPEVFHARSLLYSERLVAKHPGRAALQHRAYARALAGFHKAALEDLDQADKQNGDAKSDPAWVPLVRALCRYDAEQLSDLAAKDHRIAPLAMFFCFLTIERSGSTSVVAEFGKAALQLNPECVRLMDSITEHTGVSYRHGSTQASFTMFAETLGKRLPTMADLPAELQDVVRVGPRPEDRAKLVHALATADKTQKAQVEPSWGMLAALITEADFINVQRRAEFMCDWWGVETSDFVQRARPMFQDHPSAKLIDAYALGYQASAEQTHAALQGVQLPDVTLRALPLLIRLQRGKVDSPYKVSWFEVAFLHSSTCATDLERRLDIYRTTPDPQHTWKKPTAGILLEVSANAPLAMSTLIDGDWDSTQAKANEWEREFGEHPAVSAALGKKYFELKRYDDAERCLKQFLTRGTDFWAYDELARCYLAKKDEPKWLATMKEFLTKEDYGLDHANANAYIANHFMEKGDYATAAPYADASAQSWSSFGMWCAADCYEGLKDWKTSELWIRRIIERYGPTDRYLWWCQRTGQGDVVAAAASARQFYALPGAINSDVAAGGKATLLLMDGDPKGALEAMDTAMHFGAQPWQALHVALIKLQIRPDEAAQAFELVDSQNETDRSGAPSKELAKLMLECVKAGNDKKLPADRTDAILKSANERERASLYYFIGKFCEIRGEPNRALENYTLCVRTAPRMTYNWILSAHELRKRKIDPYAVAATGVESTAPKDATTKAAAK
jgi:tetratricopeptide (TPR) repeat protein